MIIEFRQGDVAFFRIEAIPEDAVPVRPVGHELRVEEGEHTGHNHVVAALDADLFTTADAAEQYLQVHRATTMTHPEHPTIAIEPGTYRRLPQLEYHPAAIQRMVD